MKLPYRAGASGRTDHKRFSVILSHPENAENIGLAARAMKNTGFEDLRVIGLKVVPPEASRTAVHAGDILKKARFFSRLEEATEGLELVFASTVRFRKTFTILTLEEAVEAMLRYPSRTRIGLLFGNERTGLSSRELGASNFVFFIPQAVRQPSYNLASAVLLTLFSVFVRSAAEWIPQAALPLPRQEQEDCIRIILRRLEEKGFIHPTNRTHVTEMVQDLFGRIALTEKDRRFLLALFNKAVDDKRGAGR